MRSLAVLLPTLLLAACSTTPPMMAIDARAAHQVIANEVGGCGKFDGPWSACTKQPPPPRLMLKLPASLVVPLVKGDLKPAYAAPRHMLCRVIYPKTLAPDTHAARRPAQGEAPRDALALKAQEQLQPGQAALQCTELFSSGD